MWRCTAPGKTGRYSQSSEREYYSLTDIKGEENFQKVSGSTLQRSC